MSAEDYQGKPVVTVTPGQSAARPWQGDTKDLVPVRIHVQPPTGTKRTPSDVCVIIDVSGSMGAEATITGSGGAGESHGLTLLDIAKHGVNTVINTMDENDRLTLVWFNHTAGTVLPLTIMDENGKKEATEKLETMREGGGTNIWNGLEQGMEGLRKEPRDGRMAHIMFLTDGQTTARETVMPNLEQFKKDHEQLPGTVSTFGFGYNIDSELLVMMSRFGDGTYSFIPDAGFVGTVFVNTLSNLLVTMAKEVSIEVETTDCSVEAIAGPYQMVTQGETTRIRLGLLQYEQARSVVIGVKTIMGKDDPQILANVSYQLATAETQQAEPQEVPLKAAADAEQIVGPDLLRCSYMEASTKAMTLAKSQRDNVGMQPAMALMNQVVEEIKSSPVKDDPNVKALLEDAQGQSLEALSKADWFHKWGVHYLPSILFAHSLQQCNNFKDPGVQVYGGKIFKEIQAMADETFNKLPAPTPSRARSRPSSAVSASRPAPAPVNMASYNDRYGVCIDAACSAQLLDDAGFKRVGELVKGDVVLAPGGIAAEVVCLVRTACQGARATLVELPGGARVTPFHPVLAEGQWCFPADLAEPREMRCEAVCSLVLKGAPALIVSDGSSTKEGVACVALGHGLTEGAAEHPYFGTQAAIKDLESAAGFASGTVDVLPSNVLRDPDTGLVRGFRFP